MLVTDAEYKHTLGAVRSLGRKGIYVVAGSSNRRAQSFYSRYCRRSFVYPDPIHDVEFSRFLSEYARENTIDVLLPIGYRATDALSRHREEFPPPVKLPVAGPGEMDVAGRKDKTMVFAAKLGVPTPETYESPGQVERFPVVIKGAEGSGNLRYVNSPGELPRGDCQGSVIQEYIPGEGYGFFALFNRGEPRAYFMHRRIREYPVTGGVSTAAESVFDPELRDLGLKLLGGLDWHGVAMAEFKKDSRDGLFKLMEINPKFWGSLDLAIASGVDFPYLAVRMAVDGDIDPVFEYRTGVRYQWLFPEDTLHLFANPRSMGAVISDCLSRKTKSNITLTDPVPNLVELIMTARALISGIRSGDLGYPHGVPEVRP